MVFEENPKEGERRSHVNSLRNSVPGRGNSQCKGPRAEARPVCLRNNQEARVPGVRGKSSRRDTREVMGGGRA